MCEPSLIRAIQTVAQKNIKKVNGIWTSDPQSKEVYGLPKCNPLIVAVNLEILNDSTLRQGEI